LPGGNQAQTSAARTAGGEIWPHFNKGDDYRHGKQQAIERAPGLIPLTQAEGVGVTFAGKVGRT